MSKWLLGVDTGGTFTDFVLFDGHSLRIHKRLSTPANPEAAILEGIADLGIPHEQLHVVHGSTVATNAVLERKGVKTVFISNHGLGDMLTIGRQARRQLYALQPAPNPIPVPRSYCLETGGRLDAGGQVVEPLTEQDLIDLQQKLDQLSPQAVAINLLFSFLDERFERAIEGIVPDGIFVSRSSYILPEYREYERGMTTWLNAWVGPIVERYLARLANQLPRCSISVMQSSGGTISASQAGKQAVRMLLSGPAGGLAGAQSIAAASGNHQLLTFDMGGTSTDVSLVDGDLRLTSEGSIGGYPVGVAMVDIHTIGAGGGSIAKLDAGGLLQVGPDSAGAAPGPACYGRGGLQPTVTDANAVLGRLRPDAFLGGSMSLDIDAAFHAIVKCADPLGMTIEEMAMGIIRVANEHMAQALRVISVQRGLDPRDFTLVSFGGAGGLHVCALAEALGMTRAIVPLHAGVLSALGMLVAPRTRHLSRTVTGLVSEFTLARISVLFQALEHEGSVALTEEGIAASELTVARSADLRYRGQSYTLTLPWSELAAIDKDFHQAHEQRYGHQLPLPVELVNVRVAVRGPVPAIKLEPACACDPNPAPYAQATLYGVKNTVAVWHRDNMPVDTRVPGPLLVTETVSTTYVAAGWYCQKDRYGNLLLGKVNRSS